MSLNLVTIIGNVGGSPEFKNLPSGSSVVNFTVATTEKWTKDGKKESKTEWHRVVAYGKLAEICKKYIDKGSQVCVLGKITTRNYENNGTKVYVTEINANNVQFLGSNQDVNGALKKAHEGDAEVSSNTDFASDDIPF